MKTITSIILLALLCGCATNQAIGTVGRYEVREIATHNVIAANTTALVAVDKDGEIVPLGAGGQSGMLWTAAQIGALGFIGSQLGNLKDQTVKLEQ